MAVVAATAADRSPEEGSPAAAAAAATAPPTSPRRRRCRFVVTGFGPFRGVPDNPTSVLIRRLRELDDGGGSARGSNGSDICICEAHVLETSAGDVRERIDEIYGRLGSSATAGDAANTKNGTSHGGDENGSSDDAATHDDDEKPKTTIMLHLGVNYRGTRFQLERRAYNDATFRVPDERGYQPSRECILTEEDTSKGNATTTREWGECLDTTLDVPALCEELRRNGREAVCVSTDPGRFVCNYTYCLSLDKCQSTNRLCHSTDEGGGTTCHSLFVHVPPFGVVPEGRQLDFVLEVMGAIEGQVAGSGVASVSRRSRMRSSGIP